VLVALLWTFPLQHVIAYPFVFLFFGAIIGSAWFGGLVAGSIATVMSFLVVTFFFIPSLYSMSIAKESRSFVAAFVSCAFVITVVSSVRKRAEVAIRNVRDELEDRVQEVCRRSLSIAVWPKNRCRKRTIHGVTLCEPRTWNAWCSRAYWGQPRDHFVDVAIFFVRSAH